MRWALLLLGCSAHPVVSKAPPPAPKPVASAPPPAPPHIEDIAGVTVEAVLFAPARYANRTDIAVHATREGTNVESTTAKSSFVLSFGDHTLTGCRGQKVRSYLDGPKVSHTTSYDEQQGYRGKWSRDGYWIDVELTPDDKICEPRRRYLDLMPKTWMMRCISIKKGGLVHMPALACRVTHIAESQFNEAYAHTVMKVLPGEWMVLATDNGAHVTWSEEGVGLNTLKNAVVSVSMSPTPIVDTTWEQ